MIAILNWLLEHWWVFFFLTIFGVFEGIQNFFLSLAEIIAEIGRHTNSGEKLENPQSAQLPVSAEKKPGLCVHRNVSPVISSADEVVAWLCKTCDTKLPADWAIREEDL